MKKIINFVALAAIMTAGLVATTQANQLDDLLKQVKSDRVSEAKLDKKREAEFKNARADKKALLNKAKNLKEAKKKIIELSGKTHDIYSSASVFFNNKEIWKSTQKLKVKIRNLSEKEVDKYLIKTKKQILNSVGCYQIEALGPNIIEETKGDFFNIMGFPLFPFLRFLKNYKDR